MLLQIGLFPDYLCHIYMNFPRVNIARTLMIGLLLCTSIILVLHGFVNSCWFSSDTCVEQAVGEITVAQIFQQHGESVFRDNEVCFHLLCLVLLVACLSNHSGGRVIRGSGIFLRLGIFASRYLVILTHEYVLIGSRCMFDF